jgi:hypothetical protein
MPPNRNGEAAASALEKTNKKRRELDGRSTKRSRTAIRVVVVCIVMASLLTAAIVFHRAEVNRGSESRAQSAPATAATNAMGTVRFLEGQACREAQIDNRTGRLSEARQRSDCTENLSSPGDAMQNRYSSGKRLDSIRDSFSSR